MGSMNYGVTSALCEAIDNSIQSTQSYLDRKVEVFIDYAAKVQFLFHLTELQKITIEDNGVGMLLQEQQVRTVKTN